MNSKIAEIFEEIADMLELDEVDRKFEVLAYRKAAQTIEGLQEPVEDVYARGGLEALQELPGIGKSTSSHIEEYIKTGRIKKYDELKKKFPVDFNTLTKIPGLGAKKAAKLFVALKVKDIDDLKK
ncbi:MAG: DNA polymerase III, partial [Candidatus Micrarchaeota archaeon]|nr:DNA polymerase III [Candidatus Micrarchaeota archaeon]